MANDTLQIMQSMNMALKYEGQLVRKDGHVVGIKIGKTSATVFYAEVLDNGSIAFSIRTGDTIDAHGVIARLTHNGYDYFANLLIDTTLNHCN